MFCVVVEHSFRVQWTVVARHRRPPHERHATSGLWRDNLANHKVGSGIGGPTRSKHFLRRYHSLKQRIRDGDAVLVHVPDPQMPADFLTKWIPSAKLEASLRYACNSHRTSSAAADPVPRVFMLEQSSPWARIGGSVIHPQLVALGASCEVRRPSGIVNTSWDRLLAFCMRDLLFCVVVERSIRTVDCRPPTSSPASPPPCHLRASVRRLSGLGRGLPLARGR